MQIEESETQDLLNIIYGRFIQSYCDQDPLFAYKIYDFGEATHSINLLRELAKKYNI